MKHFAFRSVPGWLSRVKPLSFLAFLALGTATQAQVYQTITIHGTSGGEVAQTAWSSVCPGAANTNYAFPVSTLTAYVDYSGSGCGDVEYNTYLQFDLSSANSNMILTKAEMYLYSALGLGPLNTGANDFYVQKVTSPWSQFTLTWNTAPTVTATGQISQAGTTNPIQDWVVDITSFANEWICGAVPNNGVRLKMQNPALPDRIVNITGSAFPGPGRWPELKLEWAEVNITMPGGGGGGPVCAGTPVTLNANINGSALPYTYSWFDDLGNPVGSTPSITVTPSVNTTYTVYVSLNGCTMSAKLPVSVKNCCDPNPAVYTKFHNQLNGNTHGSLLIGREKIYMDNITGEVFLPGYYDIGGGFDAAVTKIQSNGNNLWTAQVSSPLTDVYHTSYPLQGGNGVLVAGKQANNAMVQRLDAAGNVLWSTVIGQTNEVVFVPLMSRIASGNIILACLLSSNSGNPDSRISLIELNAATGTILQYRNVDFGKDLLPDIYDIAATGDGGFIVAGRALNEPLSTTNSYMGGFVIKYSSTISHQWTRVIRNPLISGIYNINSTNPAEVSIAEFGGIKEDPNTGGYIAVGAVSNSVQQEGWAVQLSSTGIPTASTITNIAGSQTQFKDVAISSLSGEYLVAGDNYNSTRTAVNTLVGRMSSGLNMFLPKEHVNNYPHANRIFEYPGTNDMLVTGIDLARSNAPFVLRTDLTGSNGCQLNVLSNSVASSTQNFSWIPVESLIPFTADNNYQTTQSCEPDLVICASSLRTSLPGKPQWQQTSAEDIMLGTGTAAAASVKIFPIPADNTLSLDVGSSSTSSLNVSLTDMLGRTLLSKTLPAGQQIVQLPVNELPAGIYNLTVNDANGMQYAQRVSVQH